MFLCPSKWLTALDSLGQHLDMNSGILPEKLQFFILCYFILPPTSSGWRKYQRKIFSQGMKHRIGYQELFCGLTRPSGQNPEMAAQTGEALCQSEMVPVTAWGKYGTSAVNTVPDNLAISTQVCILPVMKCDSPAAPQGTKWQEKKTTLLLTEVMAAPNYWCATKQGFANGQMSVCICKMRACGTTDWFAHMPLTLHDLERLIFSSKESKEEWLFLKKKNPHLHAILFPIQLSPCSPYRGGGDTECSF